MEVPLSSENLDVPSQIFNKFLEQLDAKKIDPKVRERLQDALLNKKHFTEKHLRTAIVGEDVK